MEQKPLLSGRGWRIAGWLVATLFLLLTLYSLAIFVNATGVGT